jgi:hypothetical protein
MLAAAAAACYRCCDKDEQRVPLFIRLLTRYPLLGVVVFGAVPIALGVVVAPGFQLTSEDLGWKPKQTETADALDAMLLIQRMPLEERVPAIVRNALIPHSRALATPQQLAQPQFRRVDWTDGYPLQFNNLGWLEVISYTPDERSNILTAENLKQLVQIERGVTDLISEQCQLQYRFDVRHNGSASSNELFAETRCLPPNSITTRLFLSPDDSTLLCDPDGPAGAAEADACVSRRLVSAALLDELKANMTALGAALRVLGTWARNTTNAALVRPLALVASQTTQLSGFDGLWRTPRKLADGGGWMGGGGRSGGWWTAVVPGTPTALAQLAAAREAAGAVRQHMNDEELSALDAVMQSAECAMSRFGALSPEQAADVRPI